MSSMLKGARKAVVRAPHRMIGSKSVEDRIIIEWTKDFNTADAALDLMTNEAKKLTSAWHDILSAHTNIADTVAELYSPIQEDNVYTAVQETPESARRTVHELQSTYAAMAAELAPVMDHLQGTFTSQCKDARKYIDGVLKALKKREHKKIDFDRHSNSVEKQSRKSGMTASDHTALERSEAELDAALETFQAQDEKVKTYIPYMLNSLSEFLNGLSTTLFLSQHKGMEIFKKHMLEFSTRQGLVANKNMPHEYVDIVEDWESRFINIQPRLEQGIPTLREGKTAKLPMDMPSKRAQKVKDGAKNIANHTSNFAHGVYQRAKHPSVAHIQFSSPSQGMFRSAADILSQASPTQSPGGSPGAPRFSSDSRTLRRTSSSSAPASRAPVGGASVRSPITSTFLDQTLDSHTLARTRALSSTSAQAVSPASFRTTSNQLLIPPKSENDEYAIAKFTFSGDEPGDVAFRRGDQLRVLDHGDEVDDMWWFGETDDGRVGLFPCNYVSITEPGTASGTTKAAAGLSSETRRASHVAVS